MWTSLFRPRSSFSESALLDSAGSESAVSESAAREGRSALNSVGSHRRRQKGRGLWGAMGALLLAVGFSAPDFSVSAGPVDALEAVELEPSAIEGQEGSLSLESVESEGAGGAGQEGAPLMVGGELAPRVCKSDEEFDVLFIGNSYTHYFDMPVLLQTMAESAGCRINTKMVAPGGARLSLHAKNGETLSAISSKRWDAVVLQNFSQLPSQPVDVVREKTFPDVKKLVDSIRENDPQTEIYYYVTWGRRDGDAKYCKQHPMVCTFDGHTEALQRGYAMYAEEFGGKLVDVGGAWAKAYRDEGAPFTSRKLYDPDGSHPSLRGSYLAASVFFASLYKASPVGLAYPSGLDEESARYIQRVAGSLPLSGA
jgi:hypothetical protein